LPFAQKEVVVGNEFPIDGLVAPLKVVSSATIVLAETPPSLGVLKLWELVRLGCKWRLPEPGGIDVKGFYHNLAMDALYME
jgi:hypothetical protein